MPICCIGSEGGGIAGYNRKATAALTAEDLGAMKIADLQSLAADRGYTISQTKKADIIQEILVQQEV